MNDLETELPWLTSSWTQLRRYIDQQRIPQALLISGNKGLGKQKLAAYFAQALLCTAPLDNGMFCGDCPSCILFKAQTHPDFTLVQPEQEGKTIGISVIRQLMTRLILKPQFDANRVVIISPADALNNASANAFLKYLEEPTERTTILLVTESPNKLPATIISRCQKLSVDTPDKTIMANWLGDQGITEDIDLLINLSQRAPLLAKSIADSSLLKLRADCFDNWLKHTNLQMNAVYLAEKWSKLTKVEINFLVEWVIGWVADMIKLALYEQSVSIVNLDLKRNLQDLVQGLDLKNLYQYYDFLLLSQQKLDTQLNKQLMLEEILIRWMQIKNQ